MPATSTHLPLARDEQASLDLRSDADLVRTPAFIGLIAAVVILVLAAGPTVNRARVFVGRRDHRADRARCRRNRLAGPALRDPVPSRRAVYLFRLAGRPRARAEPSRLPRGEPAVRDSRRAPDVLRRTSSRHHHDGGLGGAAPCLVPVHISPPPCSRVSTARSSRPRCAPSGSFNGRRQTRRNDWAFLVALGVCRLVHEFAVVLVAAATVPGGLCAAWGSARGVDGLRCA